MKYTIKYNGEYVNEIRGGYWEDTEDDTYYEDYWLGTEVHNNYAMEFETLEEAESMLDEIHGKVDYVTYSELEIEVVWVVRIINGMEGL